MLNALLDAWDRNNTILINLLHLLPEGGLDARAMEDRSPTVSQMFTHIHYVRLAFVSEDAPEFLPWTCPTRSGWSKTRIVVGSNKCCNEAPLKCGMRCEVG